MTMADDEQNQKGKQENAEGTHGDKTHQAVIDSLRQRQARDDGAQSVAPGSRQEQREDAPLRAGRLGRAT